MSFDDDLDAQLAEEKDFATVEVLVNKKVRTLKFTEMDGLEWADLADQCPPRIGVKVDTAWGYNVRAVTLLAAPKTGTLLEGDEWVELDEDQWRKLFKTLRGAHVSAIGDQIFQLNQWGPAQKVAAAKKASAVESALNLSSPAPSAFPIPDSLGGNPDS